MKSIRGKLIFITLILVLAPFALSNIAGTLMISNDMENYLKENNQFLATHVAQTVKDFIQNAYTVTEELANNNDVKSFAGDRQKNVLEDTIKRYPYFDLLYIQDKTGMQTGRSNGELGDRSGRWWFKQMMEVKKPFVSKSYYSLSGNVPVTSIFLPVYDESSNLTGIMGSDVKLDELQGVVEKAKLGAGSYSIIVDGEGVVIANPADKTQVSELYNYKTLKKTVLVKDSSGNVVKDDAGNQKTEVVDITIPSKLKEITESALAGESGLAEYKDASGKLILSAYTGVSLPGDSDKWAVITFQDKATAMGIVTNIITRNIIVALILIFLVVFIIYFVSGTITKPLINLKKVFNRAAEGELNVSAEINTKDEIGDVGKSFNLMIKNIRDLIEDVSSTSRTLYDSSSYLNTIMKQTGATTNEITSAVSEIAQNVTGQAANIKDGESGVVDLSDKIEQVLGSAASIKGVSNSTGELIIYGMEVVRKLEEKSGESAEAAKEVNEIVLNVDNSSKEITLITDKIVQLSSQTNLLALNAAIEAARAGEHGKGFAVVAEEVKNLAEESQKAVKEIKVLIQGIQSQSMLAVTSMDNTNEIILQQTAAVKETLQVFNKIFSSIDELTQNILEIEEHNVAMASSKDIIVKLIEKISSAAELNSAAAEEVMASNEEQLSSFEDVSNHMENLNELARKLENNVEKFKF